ncbi:hypothetical protein SB725_13240 [Pseudomonas sp. SIMBA_041]|uniref:hypothetical protein n=1 Tax=Pseudomonas sp. SIMBA_041 TaxID=3085782 RepID=UPI00397B92EC
MKKSDLMLLTVCLTLASAAHADDSLTPTTDYSSEFNYYGADQPFAHPVPPSMNIIPPGSYIPTSPQTFVPVSSQHVFSDSRSPTIADASTRVFIRTYDAEHGVYVNEEVLDPTCLLECLSRQGPVLQ